MDPFTATRHAEKLAEIGVDFVIFDETNFSTVTFPASNPTYQATKMAIDGFRQASSTGVKVVYQLSLTNAPQGIEYYMGNKPEVTAHIAEVYRDFRRYPDVFLHVHDPDDGQTKPLLLFYVNKGNNVMDRDTGRPFFQGFGNILPTHDQFNPIVADGERLRSLFTVRFSVWAVDQTDYRPAREVWPFECMTFGTQFVEAGYASLHFRGQGRSVSRFQQLVNEAAGKPYLVVRCFNEFSTTDEDYNGGNAFTLEVNNWLNHYDGSPNADPWHMWDNVGRMLRGASFQDPTHRRAIERSHQMEEHLRRIEDKLDKLLSFNGGD
jgi:hypothetical protein